MAVRRRILDAADDLRDDRPDVGRREVDLQVAGVETRDVQERVDDRRQPLRLRRDVAQERTPLLLAEEHVLAQERLGEAVDRRERAAQLVRHRRDELALHLLDEPLGRDVAEREDAARHGTRGIAHHRLGDREPDLLGAALDRDEPPGLAARDREAAVQDVLDGAAERVGAGGRR